MGGYVPEADDTPCDDLDPCTSTGGTEGGGDHCDGYGACLNTEPVSCFDGGDEWASVGIVGCRIVILNVGFQ